MTDKMSVNLVWYGMVWWCGVVWCSVVRCGVVWCGMVWYGMVWYMDMVILVWCLFIQHHCTLYVEHHLDNTVLMLKGKFKKFFIRSLLLRWIEN